jgi:hypothetical protein
MSQLVAQRIALQRIALQRIAFGHVAPQAPIELAALIARLEAQYESAKAALPPDLALRYTCAPSTRARTRAHARAHRQTGMGARTRSHACARARTRPCERTRRHRNRAARTRVRVRSATCSERGREAVVEGGGPAAASK